MKKYQAFFTFLKRNSFLLVLSIAINIASGISKSVGALYLEQITDSLEAGHYSFLLKFILIGGFLTFAAYALRWLGAIVARYLSEKFSCETRLKIVSHLRVIPFLKYEGYSQGELQSLIQNDSERVGQVFYIILSRILNNVFLFVFSVWAMAITNVPATIAAVIIVFVAALINQKILANMKKYEKAVQQSLSEMTHSLESTFTGMETVKTTWAKDYAVENFLKKTDKYCSYRLASTRVNALRTLWYSFIENFCLYASVSFLGFMGVSGKLTVGEVIMFIYLVKQIIMPIEVVFRWMSVLTSTTSSWERILQHMEDSKTEMPEEHAGSPAVIGAKNISFSYDGNRQILRDLNFEVKKGKLTALSGASGTGKTTLLKILTGLYESPTASYSADYKELRSLKSMAAYAGMDNSLFPMTIYENIALGDANITKEAAENALQSLGFADWLSVLPKGVDTFINDDISGGQKQAIVNSRALLSGRQLLILDEPFSALDAGHETQLQNVLAKEKQNRIILLTSHRAEAMKLADQVITL